MNKLELLKLIQAAPKNLTEFQELLSYARNIYKQVMGVFPEGIDNIAIKNAAKDIANQRDPKKVVKFPEGGKDKPGKGEFSMTILDDAGNPLETKATTPEGIMETLMGGGKTKKGELFNISGQKGKFLTEDEFARELESSVMNFKENSPGFNLQLIPELKKPGAKAYNPFPKEQGDRFLTDNQRQRVLSSLEKIMKNEEYQMRFADNFADLMEEGDDVIEFAPDMFKIDPPKKADGGRIGFSGGSTGYAGNQIEESQPGGQTDTPPNLGFQPIFPMPQKNIPASGGMSEFRKFLQAAGAPELGMGFNFPVGKSGILGVGVAPSGNVGARLKIPLSGGIFGLGKKDGGRIGFKDGSDPKDPSRRGFMKLMAGLASIPILGKLFKPAVKVADKAAPVIQEGVKLGYENFMLLVDKIKRLGKPADNLATQERQRVTTYSGKNGNEYELVEDLTTGDMTITKDKTGFIGDANETIDVIEDRSTFIYKKGEDIVDTKTGKSVRTPDEYDEVKQTSSGPEDAFDDVTEIDDRSVNEVIDELRGSAEMDDLTLSQYLGPKSPRGKKAGGGLAYMLGE